MRTISQAVKLVIQKYPFLAEAMGEGVANNAEVARRIRPDVEKLVLEEVSESAIAMALHRLNTNIRTPLFGVRFLKHLTDITVRSNLVTFVCPTSNKALVYLETLSKDAARRKGAFVNFFHGLHESLFFLDMDSATILAASLGKKHNIHWTDNLSAITLRLPEASLNVPGLYYPILKALANDGISFVEIMSVREELSIIFHEKDVDRAFSVLKRITS